MLIIRPPREDDAETLGRICYEAFASIARAHNFAPDFPSVEHATGLMRHMIAAPGSFGVVAEVDGAVAGAVPHLRDAAAAERQRDSLASEPPPRC